MNQNSAAFAQMGYTRGIDANSNHKELNGDGVVPMNTAGSTNATVPGNWQNYYEYYRLNSLDYREEKCMLDQRSFNIIPATDGSEPHHKNISKNSQSSGKRKRNDTDSDESVNSKRQKKLYPTPTRVNREMKRKYFGGRKKRPGSKRIRKPFVSMFDGGTTEFSSKRQSTSDGNTALKKVDTKDEAKSDGVHEAPGKCSMSLDSIMDKQDESHESAAPMKSSTDEETKCDETHGTTRESKVSFDKQEPLYEDRALETPNTNDQTKLDKVRGIPAESSVLEENKTPKWSGYSPESPDWSLDNGGYATPSLTRNVEPQNEPPPKSFEWLCGDDVYAPTSPRWNAEPRDEWSPESLDFSLDDGFNPNSSDWTCDNVGYVPASLPRNVETRDEAPPKSPDWRCDDSLYSPESPLWNIETGHKLPPKSPEWPCDDGQYDPESPELAYDNNGYVPLPSPWDTDPLNESEEINSSDWPSDIGGFVAAEARNQWRKYADELERREYRGGSPASDADTLAPEESSDHPVEDIDPEVLSWFPLERQYPGLGTHMKSRIPKMLEAARLEFTDLQGQRIEFARLKGQMKYDWFSEILNDKRESGQLKRKRLEPSEEEKTLAIKRRKQKKDEKKEIRREEERKARAFEKRARARRLLNEKMWPVSAWLASLPKKPREAEEGQKKKKQSESFRVPVLRAQASKHLLPAIGHYPKKIHRLCGTKRLEVLNAHVLPFKTENEKYAIIVDDAWNTRNIPALAKFNGGRTWPEVVFSKDDRLPIVNDDGRPHGDSKSAHTLLKEQKKGRRVRRRILQSVDGNFTLINSNGDKMAIYEDTYDHWNEGEISLKSGDLQTTEKGARWWNFEFYEPDDVDDFFEPNTWNDWDRGDEEEESEDEEEESEEET